MCYNVVALDVAVVWTFCQNVNVDELIPPTVPVNVGFAIGVLLTLFVSTNFSDIISIRIAIGSAIAFFIAQNLDVQIFDSLRKKIWYAAPLTSSIIGSITDTFLFFSIAFYGTGIPWVSLAFGDLVVKIFIALTMLIPFRLLISKIKDISGNSVIARN